MSSLTLERLLFDASNPADGPLLGSYLIGSAGNVLTETNVGADYGLDVNLINASIVVTATDLDIRDLTSATDSVEIKTAAGQALDIDASGYITANINGTVTVDAADLDIRDLSHVTDSVKIGDGTDFLAVETDGSINVNFAGDADDAVLTKDPVHVGAKSADQSSALGTVSAAGDATSLTADLYRRVFINDAPNIGLNSAAVTVGVTEVALPTTALAGRTRIMIQNNGQKPLFVGPTGVTTSTGLEVPKGGTLSLEAGEAIGLFGISSNAGQDIRVFELA